MNTHRTLAIGVLQIGHPLGIDATASAQLEQNRECPHGTSAVVTVHFAHVIGCSDSGDGGGMESLGVSTQTVADCLQKLQPGVLLLAVVVSQCTT